MSDQSTEFQPSVFESAVAQTRVAVNAGNPIARGWNSVTPEVIEVVRAGDVQRTEQLTAYWLKKYGA